jgi:hypothetical protein
VQALAPVAVGSAGPWVLLSTTRLDADGTAVVVISDADGVVLGRWNGVHADGGPVAPGAYQVHVRWTQDGTAKADGSATLTFLPVSNALLRSALIGPNPVTPRDRSVRLFWTPDSRTDWVRGRLYNLAGELIVTQESPADLGSQTWDLDSTGGLPVSGGLYLWEVEALSSGKVLERRVLKFVVVR